jgi:hypothetical protein
MTCEYVLGVIDGGVVDISVGDREAARRHAQGCAACRLAWEAADGLTADLARLPLPAPPHELAGIALARIARLEDGQPDAADFTAAASEIRNWPAWLTAAGGVVIAAAIVSMPSGVLTLNIGPIVLRDAEVGFPSMSSAVGLALLGAGLVLYVVGLFAPIGRKN